MKGSREGIGVGVELLAVLDVVLLALAANPLLVGSALADEAVELPPLPPVRTFPGATNLHC